MMMIETPPPAVAEPAWASRPTDAQIARLQQLYGWGSTAVTAQLTCYVRADGRLEACTSPTPAVRIGEAPWRDLTGLYRLDRSRASAAQVTFTIALSRRYDAAPALAAKPTSAQLQTLSKAGRATLLCTVDDHGTPKDCEAEAAGSSDGQAAVAALKAAPLYRFSPARLRGRPIESWSRLDVSFEDELAPEWLSKPSENDLALAYPLAAGVSGLSGRAVIRCRVLRTSQLESCVVIDETPAGLGFGGAALGISGKFKVVPQRRNGQPTDDGFITIPIAFRGFSPPEAQGYGTLFPATARSHAAAKILPWAPFTEAPTAEAMVAAMSPKARAQRASGRVEMRCSFLPDGRLTDCVSLGLKDPYDLTPAAQRLTSQFKVDLGPMTKAQMQDLYLTVPFSFGEPAADAGERRLHKVDWVSQPDAAPPYPQKARADGILSATALLDCRVGARGVLEDCRVASETATGYGFGSDAIAMAALMRANLWTREGEPSVGGRVRVPFRFIDTGDATPPAP